MTSSWFFLSTLNYDARSTTHQIPYYTLIILGFSHFLCFSLLTLGPSELLQPYEPTFESCAAYTYKNNTFASCRFLINLLRSAVIYNYVRCLALALYLLLVFETDACQFQAKIPFEIYKRRVLFCVTEF